MVLICTLGNPENYDVRSSKIKSLGLAFNYSAFRIRCHCIVEYRECIIVFAVVQNKVFGCITLDSCQPM